jgi:hypothetical protein
MGETGEAEVPVPTADDVPLELGMKNGGEVPLIVVVLDASATDDDEVVKVVVSVSGSVMVVSPVLTGAVGAVLTGAVSLHGVGKAGADEPVTGLPSVDESTPDGMGK